MSFGKRPLKNTIDPTGGASPIDGETGMMRVINEEHALLHNGQFFSGWQYDLSLADNASILYEIRSPADRECHLKQAEVWGAEGPWLLELIKGPTITTPGTTPLPIWNRYCSCIDDPDYAAETEIYTNPAGISGGDTIEAKLFGGVAGGFFGGSSAGGSLQDIEWELNHGETYVLRVTNITGSANPLHTEIYFYELADN